MIFLSSLAFAGAMSQGQSKKPAEVEINPLQLKIRRTDSMNVTVDNWFDLENARQSSLDSFVKAADGYSFVFLGESHDDPVHHQIQADVIEGLVKRGRTVIVGF